MAKLDQRRMKKVARAEVRAGIKDGHTYRLPGRGYVRVSVQFYPRERWIVEDVDMGNGGASIASTGRLLTDDEKSKLENWL